MIFVFLILIGITKCCLHPCMKSRELYSHIDEWVSFKLFTSLFHCLDCRANNNFDNKSVITNFSNLVCQFGFRMGYKLLCIKPVFMETIVFEARVEINFKNNVSTKGNCNSISNGNFSFDLKYLTKIDCVLIHL